MLTWSGGGAGAHPQFQFHVHVPALMADCGWDAPPAAHPAGLQFQFQIHVSGSVPAAEGVTETPVPSGRAGPLAAAAGAATVLAWVTAPSFPGLLTRITTLRFATSASPAAAAAAATSGDSVWMAWLTGVWVAFAAGGGMTCCAGDATGVASLTAWAGSGARAGATTDVLGALTTGGKSCVSEVSETGLLIPLSDVAGAGATDGGSGADGVSV